MFFNWKIILIFAITIVLSYISGFLIEKYKEKPKLRTTIYVISLIAVTAPLIVFKFVPFFYDVYQSIANALKSIQTNGVISVVVPLGISFYTFQTIAYITDIYREVTTWEKHFGYHALFLLFFPKVIQGPIERANDLIPQLKASETASIKDVDFPEAFRIMLVGFFKKVAIADLFGIIVAKTFDNVGDANGLMVLVSVLCYAVQIYADFSGYSDIAIASSKLFGINLQDNFDLPYESKSIREYWTRWHITLGTWFRDYIFTPLAHARVNPYLCTIIIFLISGLWHGASYNFIIWGVMHGIFQVVGMLTLRKRNKFWKKRGINTKGPLVSTIRVIITFSLIAFSSIFFRANTVGDACTLIAKLFTDWGVEGGIFPASYSAFGLSVFPLVYGILVVFTIRPIEFLKRLSYQNQKPTIYNKIYSKGYVRYAIYVVMIFCVACAWVHLQSSDVPSSFIYFQF